MPCCDRAVIFHTPTKSALSHCDKNSVKKLHKKKNVFQNFAAGLWNKDYSKSDLYITAMLNKKIIINNRSRNILEPEASNIPNKSPVSTSKR
jgi:hypothetical protein